MDTQNIQEQNKTYPVELAQSTNVDKQPCIEHVAPSVASPLVNETQLEEFNSSREGPLDDPPSSVTEVAAAAVTGGAQSSQGRGPT